MPVKLITTNVYGQKSGQKEGAFISERGDGIKTPYFNAQ